MQTHKDVWWSVGDQYEYAYFRGYGLPYPLLEFTPWPIKVTGIFFPDGSSQFTAGGGGGGGQALLAGPGIQLVPGVGTITIVNTQLQTPWLSNINGNGFALSNVAFLQVSGAITAGGAVSGGNLNISGAGNIGGGLNVTGQLLLNGLPVGPQLWLQGSAGAIYYNAGPVSIGTATPFSPNALTVAGNAAIVQSGATRPALGIVGFSGNGVEVWWDDSFLRGGIDSQFSNVFYPFWINGNPLLLNTAGDNSASFVGISILNPAYKLDVAGDINITDPGGTNGYMFRINGVPISSGAGSQTPWLSNIDADGFNLINANTISGATLALVASLSVGIVGPTGIDMQGGPVNIASTSNYIDLDAPTLTIGQLTSGGNEILIDNTGVLVKGATIVQGSVNLTGTGVNYYVNGVPISSGGAAQTPWESNINANGFALSGVSVVNLQAGGELQINSVPVGLWLEYTGVGGGVYWPGGGGPVAINGTPAGGLSPATLMVYGDVNITGSYFVDGVEIAPAAFMARLDAIEGRMRSLGA